MKIFRTLIAVAVTAMLVSVVLPVGAQSWGTPAPSTSTNLVTEEPGLYTVTLPETVFFELEVYPSIGLAAGEYQLTVNQSCSTKWSTSDMVQVSVLLGKHWTAGLLPYAYLAGQICN